MKAGLGLGVTLARQQRCRGRSCGPREGFPHRSLSVAGVGGMRKAPQQMGGCSREGLQGGGWQTLGCRTLGCAVSRGLVSACMDCVLLPVDDKEVRVASVPKNLSHRAMGELPARCSPRIEGAGCGSGKMQRDASAVALARKETFSSARRRGSGHGGGVADLRMKVRDRDCSPLSGDAARRKGLGTDPMISGNKTASFRVSWKLRYPPPKMGCGRRQGGILQDESLYVQTLPRRCWSVKKECCDDSCKDPALPSAL